jgi:hypothetical protein
MLLSCFVLNKEQFVHLYALMSFTPSHIEYIAVFGEFALNIMFQTLPAEGPYEILSLYFM